METKEVTEERRSHQRTALKASVNWTSETNFYTGFANDIGQGGIFVATHQVMPMDSVIEVEFSIPGRPEPIRAEGKVRWVREYNDLSDAEPGMGIQFQGLPGADREQIQAFVGRRDSIFYED